MAPYSAMKVPVFSILLSPSSPQISSAGLEREGRKEGGGEKEEGRRGGKQKVEKGVNSEKRS